MRGWPSLCCLAGCLQLLGAMQFPGLLPLFCSLVLLLLNLVSAWTCPSIRDDSDLQTAIPVICSLVLTTAVLALTVYRALTTRLSSQTWMAMNCFHMCLALTCEFTPVWYFHRNPTRRGLAYPSCAALVLVVLLFVYSLQIGGLVLMLQHWRHAGSLVTTSGVTLASLYVNLFYLWALGLQRMTRQREVIQMEDQHPRDSWCKGSTDWAWPTLCLVIDVSMISVSWVLTADPQMTMPGLCWQAIMLDVCAIMRLLPHLKTALRVLCRWIQRELQGAGLSLRSTSTLESTTPNVRGLP